MLQSYVTWVVLRSLTGHDHGIEDAGKGPPLKKRAVLDLGRSQLVPFIHQDIAEFVVVDCL